MARFVMCVFTYSHSDVLAEHNLKGWLVAISSLEHVLEDEKGFGAIDYSGSFLTILREF
jgi:hypothetical protein